MFDFHEELDTLKTQLHQLLIAQRRRAMNELNDAERKLTELGWQPRDEHRYPVLSAEEATAQHQAMTKRHEKILQSVDRTRSNKRG